MTRNDDGAITLRAEDRRRLDALLVWADAHVRDPGTTTSEDANKFIADWKRVTG